MKKFILISIVSFFWLHSFGQNILRTNYYFKDLKESEGYVDEKDQKQGKWKYWCVDGNLHKQQAYLDDKREGEYEEYMAACFMKKEEIEQDTTKYKNSLLNQRKSGDSNVLLKGQYKNNIPVGTWSGFSNQEKISEIEYHLKSESELIKRIYFLKAAERTLYSEEKYINNEKKEESKYYKSKFLSKRIFYSNNHRDSLHEMSDSGLFKKQIYFLENDEIRTNYFNEKGKMNRFIIHERTQVIDEIACTKDSAGKFVCDTQYTALGRYKVSQGHKLEFRYEPYGNIEEVDVVPEFPGGLQAMFNFIAANCKYPDEAKRRGVQGKVYVNFVVGIDGTISEAHVIRGIGGGCDEEALRVVNLMPKWNPGSAKGVPVKVNYKLPVTFKLSER